MITVGCAHLQAIQNLMNIAIVDFHLASSLKVVGSRVGLVAQWRLKNLVSFHPFTLSSLGFEFHHPAHHSPVVNSRFLSRQLRLFESF